MMRIKSLNSCLVLCLTTLMACAQNQEAKPKAKAEKEHSENSKVVSHNYGGWYCPDNLNGFPAVDLANWHTVPVISDRLPTQKEAKSEASLIYVDPEKYPEASTFDLTLPQLATFQSPYTDRNELIIVIQAVKIGNDSIIGFRYLNGGNGSARLDEVEFIAEAETELPASGRFVNERIFINAKADKIRKVLTATEFAPSFQSVLNKHKNLQAEWRTKTNVNFSYPKAGNLSSQYANMLYGNFYVQNDYEEMNYTEKFMVIENEVSGLTELKIVCGPYEQDYAEQKAVLKAWAKEVKKLSEQQ